jgi:hypothetical protein
MLYVPLILGVLVAGAPTSRTLLLWIAVTATFLGRDALVQWGHARRRGRSSPYGRLAVAYLVIAALVGLLLVVIDRLVVLVPIVLFAAIALAWNLHQSIQRQERTTAAELVAIGGLTLTAPAAYYVAAGRIDMIAIWLWVLCIAFFASSVFYVKQRVLALQTRKLHEQRRLSAYSATYHALLLATLGILVWQEQLHLLVLLAFLPVVARATWHLARPIRELDLKRIGVAEISFSVTFLVLTWLGFVSG